MEIECFKEYQFDLSGTLSFGKIPEQKLIESLSSGRLCGVLIEEDVSNRFSNLTSEGCTQGEGPDIFKLTENNTKKTIQAKTVKLKKQKKKNKIPYLAECKDKDNIGWTTKSGLWDTTRGAKKSEALWDAEHNGYFNDYDYFMYIAIDDFPRYKVIMVPTSALKNRPEVVTQQKEYHFGKSKRKKVVASYAPDSWEWPIHITKGMYEDFKYMKLKG